MSWSATGGTYIVDLKADDTVVFSIRDSYPSKLLSGSEVIELDRALKSAAYVKYFFRKDGSGQLFIAMKGNDTGSHISIIVTKAGYRIARGV